MRRALRALVCCGAALVLFAGAAALAQNRDLGTECGAALDKAVALHDAGRYREALPYYEKALALAPQAFGKDHTNTAMIQYNAARGFLDMGQYARAEPLFQRSLAIREAKLGKDHIDVADTLNGLAVLHSRLSQYAKAEPLYQRSMAIREAKLGKDHPEVAQSLNNLGLNNTEMGQYARAESLFQRSLEIREARLDKLHPDIAQSLNNMALLYLNMGQYARAEPLYQRSLRIWQAKLGKDHPNVAQSLSNLGGCLLLQGEYLQAEPLFLRSRDIREAALGKDHPDVAESLNVLAVLYCDLGQYAKAEPLHLRSLEIRELKLGKDHPDVAQSLNNLGILYRSMGQYARAEALYLRCLQIKKARMGEDHPDVAAVLNNLANMYQQMGQYAKAEPVLQRTLEIKETKLGKDHPSVAATLNNLAELYRETGQYTKAEPLYLRSLEIHEAKLGKDHPDTANPLNNLIVLYAAQEKWSEATRLGNRFRRQARAYTRYILPSLSDNEQLKFLQNTDETRFHISLSLGLERRADPAIAADSAAWLVNGKAIAQESLSERSRLALASTDPQTSKIAGQLSSVRQQLAGLTQVAPKSGQEATRLEQIASLTEQEQQLSRKLGQLIGQPSRTDAWVTIEEVRQALPADGILIDIARFRVADFKSTDPHKNWKAIRYAAWLIPPAGQGDVRVIDLGDAARIDAAVAAVRQGLLAAQGSAQQKSTIQEKGEAEAEKALQPALAALAKLVLEPLAEPLNSKKQWILSPDGALWLVPWAALPLSDGSYVIEKHQITHVISGRDLVTPAFTGKIKRDAPLVMADPDFDIEPKEAAILTSKLLGKQPFVNDSQALSLGAPLGTRSTFIGRVGRLPATAAEAVAIKPKIQVYTGEEPWVYRGKNALEGVFKAWHSPKVLVLSTHGFFLDDQEAKRSAVSEMVNQRPALTNDGKLMENPLLHCGLLLAGCNERAKASGKQEDGVLTGLEIVGCDLRGTELVVLSACETGLGQVRNSEGVAGLRQAFQLAGARTVVASLWQVSDRDTSLLMSDFFDGLAKGKNKAEALREAQLARIKAHQDRDGAAHPYFWAAFTLTGR